MLEREANLFSKSPESLSFRGKRPHCSLLRQEMQQPREADGGGEKDGEAGKMKRRLKRRRDGGRAGNHSLHWASANDTTWLV